MTALFAAGAAALGILVFLSGLPIPRRPRMAMRVEPYIAGIHGRPSGLLARPQVARRGVRAWLQRMLSRSSRVDARLAERLAAADIACSPAEFRVRQMSWGIGCAAGSLALFGIAALNGMSVNPVALPAVGTAAFWFSFLARDWWLTHQMEERRTVIREELPTAIDLVTLSIMAGDSVPSALARAAESMPSAIGTELFRVLADIRAGEPVVDALEGLKGRIPDYGIARFIDALCTGIERGAPLAEVLRAQADDARENRRRELIELGGKREVLMLVPVVFLIMPVVVLFALLPGLVSLNLIVP